MTVRFAKYQGLGNDFLVVDLRAADVDSAAQVQDPAIVRALCDRQFGVGGDGVLAILPPTTPGADARMRVLNADGSEAEMCGNGIRCVAIELHDRGGVRKPRMIIDTGAGPLACELDADPIGAHGVTVAMGKPRLLRGEIPMTGPAGERCIDQPLVIEPGPETASERGRAGIEPVRTITAVSMGNPHAITFVNSLAEAYELARRVGPRVEHHAAFPNRTNAEFAFVRDRHTIDLVVWERGCGITLACGTGACATAVAAILTGRVDRDAAVTVNLPGGDLSITVRDEGVFMRGPARRVFDGELDPGQLAVRPRSD